MRQTSDTTRKIDQFPVSVPPYEEGQYPYSPAHPHHLTQHTRRQNQPPPKSQTSTHHDRIPNTPPPPYRHTIPLHNINTIPAPRAAMSPLSIPQITHSQQFPLGIRAAPSSREIYASEMIQMLVLAMNGEVGASVDELRC